MRSHPLWWCPWVGGLCFGGHRDLASPLPRPSLQNPDPAFAQSSSSEKYWWWASLPASPPALHFRWLLLLLYSRIGQLIAAIHTPNHLYRQQSGHQLLGSSPGLQAQLWPALCMAVSQEMTSGHPRSTVHRNSNRESESYAPYFPKASSTIQYPSKN